MLVLLSALALAGSPSDAVRDAVAARMGVPPADVEISGIGALPGAPADAAADWAVALPGTGPVTGDLRVVVRTGATRYSIFPHVVVWRDLPVAADAVAPNAVVPLSRARISSDRLRGGAPVSPDAAWTARIGLAAGDPVTTANARPAPDARKGSDVRIIAVAGPLSVTAPGRLLDDCFVGAQVAVLNLATRSVVTGTYRGDAVVGLETP